MKRTRGFVRVQAGLIACRPRRSRHRRRHLPQHLAGRGQLDGCISLARSLSGAAFTPTALTALLTRTEYVLPQPDACWVQILMQNDAEFAGFSQGNWQAFTPGQHVHGELDGAAEPPGIEQQGADVAQPCPACRSGDTLSVAFFPFVDHAGNRRTTDPGVATDLSLYLDGTLVDSQLVASAQFVLSPGRAPRS